METNQINRSPLFPNPDLAHWLKSQERTIVPAWISAVQQTTAEIQHSFSALHLESVQLMCFFDSIVNAVETGKLDDVDLAVEELVENRLGRGYSLTDFLQVAHELKTTIWKALQEKFSPVRTLNAILDLEPIFAHSVVCLALIIHRTAETKSEEEPD